MSTDPSPEVASLARRLYETYCDALSLEPGLITALPEWDGLDAPQIAAWESVAVEARVDVAEDAQLPHPDQRETGTDGTAVSALTGSHDPFHAAGRALYERSPGSPLAAWDELSPAERRTWAAAAAIPDRQAPPPDHFTVASLPFTPGDTLIVQYRSVLSAADYGRIREGLLEAGARHVLFIPAAVTGLSALALPPPRALTLPPPRTDARQEWASPPDH